MLILHAAQVKENFVLWSEDSEPLPGPTDRQADGSHPFCAQAQLVAEAVGLETGGGSFASAIAWLPSRGDFPVPSSPMAGLMPKSRAKPRIRPWTVTTLPLKPELAIPLLQECRQRQVLKPGVAIGTDLAYWAHALPLAVSLAARQHSCPACPNGATRPWAHGFRYLSARTRTGWPNWPDWLRHQPGRSPA